MHNIEKSKFHKGEYVGYADGCVFRITRCNTSYGNWCATVSHGDNHTKHLNRPLFAHRLLELSRKLEALNIDRNTEASVPGLRSLFNW
jgi:hypothetical protein